MSIKTLSASELHSQTLQAAAREKGATLELLRFLAEVDRRRLYAERAYSSLWEYVHKALGYSESQASERVAAMRLMNRVPAVEQKLSGGELSLTSAAKLAFHVRRERLEDEATRELLSQVAGKSSREVERVLVSRGQAPARPERVRAITPELTRVSFDVDAEFMALAERARELGGHAGMELKELFTKVLREFVAKREVKPSESKMQSVGQMPSADKKQDAQELRAPEAEGRYLRVADRTGIRRRSGDRCEYVDPGTGRRCEARHRLEFDHIRVWARGGSNGARNLRHYCAVHNRLAAIQAFGAAKLRRYGVP
jgi:hypothetical protein